MIADKKNTKLSVKLLLFLAVIGMFALPAEMLSAQPVEPGIVLEEPAYNAVADGSLIDLEAALLNLVPLANTPLGHAYADVDSTKTSENAYAYASNISLGLLGIPISLDRLEATSPEPQNPSPRSFLSVPLAPIASAGVLNGNVESNYTSGNFICNNELADRLISRSEVSIAGIDLVNVPTTSINLARIGAASKIATTEVVGDSIVSTVSSEVADIHLLGDRIRVDVSDNVVLSSKSNGAEGSTTFSNTLVRVYLDNVLHATLEVGSGASIGISLGLGGLLSANVNIGVGTFTDTSSGAIGSGTLDSILGIGVDVTGLLGLEVVDLNLRVGGMDTEAAVDGSLSCGDEEITCENLNVWGTLTPKYGINGDEEFSSVAEAMNNCFLRCPELTINTNGITDNVKEASSNQFVPLNSEINDDESRGGFCFELTDEQSQELIRNVETVADSNVPAYWTTSVQDGMSPGEKPGDAFTVQSKRIPTNYGQLLEDCLLNDDECNFSVEDVDYALALDETATRASLDLSDINRNALAQGGVLNIFELTYNAPVLNITGVPQTCTQTREASYVFRYTTSGNASMSSDTTGDWSNNCESDVPVIDGPILPGLTENPGGWTNDPTAIGRAYQYLTANQTPDITNFAQVFSTHCNVSAIDYLDSKNQNLLRERSVDDASAVYSVYAVTENLGDPANAIFGSLVNDESNTKGFYDRQCAFNGAPVETPDVDPEATFFRDGEKHRVTVDLYRPNGSGFGSFTDAAGNNIPTLFDDGLEASRTFITKWNGGTPRSDGPGQARAQGSNDQQFFSPTEREFPILKNFEETPIMDSRNWGIIEGQHNEIYWSAVWASEPNKPQVYKVRWEYMPLVAQYIPGMNITFDSTGGFHYTRDVEQARIQGSVESHRNNEPSLGNFDEAFESTGTPYTGHSPETDTRSDAFIDLSSAMNSDGELTVSALDLGSVFRTIEFVRATGS